jgi:hypothetical protein
VLKGALSALHIITWKFVIIAFTRVETENAVFKPRSIWRDAVRRWQVRLTAYIEGVRRWRVKRRARGDLEMPDAVRDRHAAVLAPVYKMDSEGWITRHPSFSVLEDGLASDARADRLAARRKRLQQQRTRAGGPPRRRRAAPPE